MIRTSIVTVNGSGFKTVVVPSHMEVLGIYSSEAIAIALSIRLDGGPTIRKNSAIATESILTFAPPRRGMKIEVDLQAPGDPRDVFVLFDDCGGAR